MKKNLTILSAVLLSFVYLTGCSPTSHVEVAKGVNFASYKTFGWVNNGVVPATPATNDIVDNNIRSAVGGELISKGWSESEQSPDVLLDYNVMVEKGVRQESDPVYNYPYSSYYYNWRSRRLGYYYSPSFFSGYRTYNVPIKVGTLTVNMVDTKTNKLIWQGWAKGDVTNSGVTTQAAEADVKSIFKKLNLPGK